MLLGNGFGFWKTIPIRRRTTDRIDPRIVDILRRDRESRPSPGAVGTRSFIRLIQRNTVLFPHPDGPINAVIRFLAISNLTLPTAWKFAVMHIQVADTRITVAGLSRASRSNFVGMRQRNVRAAAVELEIAITSVPFRCTAAATMIAIRFMMMSSPMKTMMPAAARVEKLMSEDATSSCKAGWESSYRNR